MSSEVFLRDSTNNDEFERDNTAQGLFQVITGLRSGSPLVVGIHGTWGSGKTDFMRRIEKRVKAKDQPYKTVWFEPWKYERKEDVGAALIQTVLKRAADDQGEPNKFKALGARISRAFRGAASAAGEVSISIPGGIASADVKNLVEAFNSGYAESELNYVVELDDLIDDLKSVIVEWVGDQRLVLFVDDLDRCLPDQMIRALEAIHLYLASLPMIAFIALDSGAFASAVKKRFGETYQGAAYVDKVVDIAFNLPAPSSKQLLARYRPRLEELELKSSNIAKILQVGFGSNPRTYERFINRMIGLRAAHRCLEIFKIDRHVELLAMLVIVQMQFPEFLQTILGNPLGFRQFIGESDATDPKPERMREQSAVEFTKYFKSESKEWEFFYSVREAAMIVCAEARYDERNLGPAWEEITDIFGPTSS